MSTADACVFGAAPNAVDAPENIFDAVESCACVSSPMTTSHFMRPPRYLALCPPPSCADPFRYARVPIRRLLESMRDVEEPGFGKRVALHLQSDRHPVAIEPAGYRQRGSARQVCRDRENIVQVHLDRIVGLGADREGGGRRGRSQITSHVR